MQSTGSDKADRDAQYLLPLVPLPLFPYEIGGHRALYPVVEVGREGGLAVEPSLDQVAALIAEPVALPGGLHALGHHPMTHGVRHRQHGPDDRLVAAGLADVRDERAVDLDDADRQ